MFGWVGHSPAPKHGKNGMVIRCNTNRVGPSALHVLDSLVEAKYVATHTWIYERMV